MSKRKHVGTLARMFFAVIAGISTALARASDVDWKFYGGASFDQKALCFYDARGVVNAQDGHVRVWTKCLLQKDIDSINVEKDFDGKILENTAQKLVKHYIPPYANVEPIDANEIVFITGWEETANISDIQPHVSIFHELNCSDRMI